MVQTDYLAFCSQPWAVTLIPIIIISVTLVILALNSQKSG